MRSMTAYPRRLTCLALGILLALAVVPQAAATPATPAISEKQAAAAAAAAELERMNAALEVQVEEYNAISEALEQTAAEIAIAKVELIRAEADLAETREELEGRATSMYKDGGTGMLDVLLGTTSFEDFLVRLDYAVRLGRSNAEMVSSVKQAKADVEATARALEQRRAEQLALQAEASSRAQAIESDVAAQTRFLSQLEDEVRTLIAEEEAHQRALAEERARQAARAAAQAEADKGSTGGDATDRDPTDPGSLKPEHPEVVAIALEYLGVPYVWGGSSPSGFDCSGLTQYCYRQIGITIPRTSQSQYNAGQHIARDRLDVLKPGDLVFFGTDGDDDRVHHVGMYVGDGNYVHAPYTGAVVRVDSLNSRIASKGDYVGASRF